MPALYVIFGALFLFLVVFDNRIPEFGPTLGLPHAGTSLELFFFNYFPGFLDYVQQLPRAVKDYFFNPLLKLKLLDLLFFAGLFLVVIGALGISRRRS